MGIKMSETTLIGVQRKLEYLALGIETADREEVDIINRIYKALAKY